MASILSDTSDNDSPLPPDNDIAAAVAHAARADREASGESPPPSRPAPQMGRRRRQQYKSTENVTKLLGNSTDDANDIVGNPPTPPAPRRSRRSHHAETSRTNGWDDSGRAAEASKVEKDIDDENDDEDDE
ncbi:hypothetical protein HK104_006168, partial [Borealophlyctis nickersoniae]